MGGTFIDGNWQHSYGCLMLGEWRQNCNILEALQWALPHFANQNTQNGHYCTYNFRRPYLLQNMGSFVERKIYFKDAKMRLHGIKQKSRRPHHHSKCETKCLTSVSVPGCFATNDERWTHVWGLSVWFLRTTTDAMPLAFLARAESLCGAHVHATHRKLLWHQQKGA